MKKILLRFHREVMADDWGLYILYGFLLCVLILMVQLVMEIYNPTIQQKDIRLTATYSSKSPSKAKEYLSTHNCQNWWSSGVYCGIFEKSIKLTEERRNYIDSLLKNDNVLYTLVKTSVQNSDVCFDIEDTNKNSNKIQSERCTAISIKLKEDDVQNKFEIQPFEIQNQYKMNVNLVEASNMIKQIKSK